MDANQLLKELRELTGAGMLEIKHALNETGNDKEKTIELLRKKGALKVGKKADRIANEGLIETYIHPGNRIGVLIEINCETDFVARTDDFKNLAKDLALHIAASNPLYVNSSEIPPEVVEKEKEIYKESASGGKGKSDEIINKILEGKIAKYYEEVCLMDQPFAKNPGLKIREVLAEAVAKMGEKIEVKKFARFVLGN